MSTETRKSTAAIAPFGLRMQPELRELVEKAAQSNNRSMNAEIVARLEATFSPNETAPQSLAATIAAEAAVKAIDVVLKALNAPEGTSDAERFRILVRATNKIGRDDRQASD